MGRVRDAEPGRVRDADAGRDDGTNGVRRETESATPVTTLSCGVDTTAGAATASGATVSDPSDSCLCSFGGDDRICALAGLRSGVRDVLPGGVRPVWGDAGQGWVQSREESKFGVDLMRDSIRSLRR